jgi:demethylmenaquinone methyltransferase/2-methoxy-6-polyprenyl-1,4-benzoquinol methylase
VFDRIAPDYDRFNSWASLGLHHQWRRALVRRIPQGVRVLDEATGTGDLALLASAAGHEVFGLDISEAMLTRARQKDEERRIRWVLGSADRLPFSDRSFGCVTSAFALRNLRTQLDAVLRENGRVLKPGGKVLHLDFGRPKSPWSRWGHRLHLRFGIPMIGWWICQDRWPKEYLETTIREFYDPTEMVDQLSRAGFVDVRYTPIMGGIVQLYEGMKR